MDAVIVEVCTDAVCSVSYTVFNWGDGAIDGNTSVGAAGYTPGEPDNDGIPEAVLYGTPPLRVGIEIDVDPVAPPGVYPYVRLTSPSGGASDGSEIDALQVLPPPPTATSTATPVPTATRTPTATLGLSTSYWWHNVTSPLAFMMYPLPPSGSLASSSSSVTFYSDAFSGGETVGAGTATLYLSATSGPSGCTVQISARGGATVLGTGTIDVPPSTVSLTMFSDFFPLSSYIFSAGERLSVEVDLGLCSGVSVYWDGAANSSRLQLP
jgi:hypothetical protein